VTDVEPRTPGRWTAARLRAAGASVVAAFVALLLLRLLLIGVLPRYEPPVRVWYCHGTLSLTGDPSTLGIQSFQVAGVGGDDLGVVAARTRGVGEGLSALLRGEKRAKWRFRATGRSNDQGCVEYERTD